VTQPDDLHPFRVEHIKPAVTCEWDLISLQISQITALRCRVKNLEDVLRDVSGELDTMIVEVRRDSRWLCDPRQPFQLDLKDYVLGIMITAADASSVVLSPVTTIISDAEID